MLRRLLQRFLSLRAVPAVQAQPSAWIKPDRLVGCHHIAEAPRLVPSYPVTIGQVDDDGGPVPGARTSTFFDKEAFETHCRWLDNVLPVAQFGLWFSRAPA
jgi:hypothetical protein